MNFHAVFHKPQGVSPQQAASRSRISSGHPGEPRPGIRIAFKRIIDIGPTSSDNEHRKWPH
jgi:hypothetical protein